MNDLMRTEEDACEAVSGRAVAKNSKDNLIPTSEHKTQAFPKAEVHDTFHHAYGVFYAAMRQHMVEWDIGKRVQSTVMARLPSCEKQVATAAVSAE